MVAMAQVADQAAVRARLASSDFNNQLRNLLNQNGVAFALTAHVRRPLRLRPLCATSLYGAGGD